MMTRRHSPQARHGRHSFTILRTPSIAATLLFTSFSLPAQEPAAAPAGGGQPAGGGEPAVVVPATDAPDAAALLRSSREKVGGYRTLKATMTETIDLGPTRRFRAEGTYLQAAGNKVRVELEVEVGKSKGDLLQVSDGDVLWNEYDTGEAPKITRRDLKQILAAAGGPEAKSSWLSELGLGGIPALLSSIEGTMDFKPAMTAKIEGRTFYVIEGGWKPAVRQRFDEQLQQSPSPPNGPTVLPIHIPELVRLYFDAETLFPYRIRYLKQSTAAGTEPRPLLTLDFSDIVVNASLDAEAFRYTVPDKAVVQDTTKIYLDQLQAQAPPAQPAAAPQ